MINNLNGVNYAKNNIFENNLYQKTVNYFGIAHNFLTAPVFDEIKAQNKDETTISIWPARYTPSRVLATAGYGAKAAVKGIDPIIEAYQKLHPNVKIKVIGQAINKDIRRWMNTL